MSVLPTFTRASTAYKEDGTSVASGVPRIESSGVKIEEGTTNLIPSSTVLVKYSPSEYTTEVVTEGEYTGWTKVILSYVCSQGYIGYLPVYPISAGSSRSFSIEFVSLTSKVIPTLAGGTEFAMSVIDGNRYSVTYTNSTTGALYLGIYFISRGYKGQFVSETFYYRNVQYEDKAYATSFTPTTRSAEALTIPSSALSVTEGTIEFDFIAPQNIFSGGASVVITLNSDFTNKNCLDVQLNATRYIQLFVGAGSSYNRLDTNVVAVAGTKYRVSFRWSSTSVSIAVNGVIKATINSPAVFAIENYIYLGRLATSTYFLNSTISNLRISNKARSDTELAYTGDLAVDYYTTYLLPCKTSLVPKNF